MSRWSCCERIMMPGFLIPLLGVTYWQTGKWSLGWGISINSHPSAVNSYKRFLSVDQKREAEYLRWHTKSLKWVWNKHRNTESGGFSWIVPWQSDPYTVQMSSQEQAPCYCQEPAPQTITRLPASGGSGGSRELSRRSWLRHPGNKKQVRKGTETDYSCSSLSWGLCFQGWGLQVCTNTIGLSWSPAVIFSSLGLLSSPIQRLGSR